MLTVVKNSKGGDSIIFNGFTFYLEKVCLSGQRWAFKLKGSVGCKAKLRTLRQDDGYVLKDETGFHCHEPRSSDLAMYRANSEVRTSARDLKNIKLKKIQKQYSLS